MSAAPTPAVAAAPDPLQGAPARNGTATELPFYRPLGRTGLQVSCLGIGGGGGLSSEDTLYAYDQGINYFFYSSDLHQFRYRSMAGALRKICGRGSSVRENVVLAVVTYTRTPKMIRAVLLDQFLDLGIDYADLFFWGWIDSDDAGGFGSLAGLAPHLRGPGTRAAQFVEEFAGASERLKEMGAVRYVGASFHDLGVAAQWLGSPLVDVVMVRHNPAHRSAQWRLFDSLDGVPAVERPGIVTFKSLDGANGALWRPPARLPEGCWVPRPGDLYRYSLAQNAVDVCLTGPRRRAEVDAALAAVRGGPLTPAEVRYLDHYGNISRPDGAKHSIPFDALLVRSE